MQTLIASKKGWRLFDWITRKHSSIEAAKSLSGCVMTTPGLFRKAWRVLSSTANTDLSIELANWLSSRYMMMRWTSWEERLWWRTTRNGDLSIREEGRLSGQRISYAFLAEVLSF